MARAAASAAPIPTSIDPGITSTEGAATTSDQESVTSAVDDFIEAGDPPDDEDLDDNPDDPDSEEESEEESEVDEETPEAGKKGPLPKIEKVRVNDGSGSREVDVDFSDRDTMRRYVQQAHGAMKLFRRGETMKRELAVAREEATGLRESAEKGEVLEEILSTEGHDSLIKHLTGKTLREHQDVHDRRSRWLADKNTTPEMKEELFRREAAEEVKRMRDFDAKKAERAKTSSDQKTVVAETAALQARVNPIFDKYRYAGKLGDPAREHRLDSMIWNEARNELDSILESGVKELTPELIAGVFREARDTLGVVIEKQAVKKASDIRRKQAVKAKNAAASEARRGASRLSEQANNGLTDQDFLDPSRLADLMSQSLHSRRRK